MQKRQKRMLTTAAVTVAVVVVASVGLRLLLTRERLESMLVPRIEKAVGAKIGIGDIGVRFPFGFGVKVSDLSFEKEIPDKGRLRISSASTDVSVSLISLIRKRPDIKSVSIGGGGLSFYKPDGTVSAVLSGIEGRLSVEPGDSLYSGVIDLKVGEARTPAGEAGAELVFRDIAVSAEGSAPFDLSRIEMPEIALAVGDHLKAGLSLLLTDPAGDGAFEVSVESAGNDVPGLVSYLEGTGLAGLMPAEEGSEKKLLPIGLDSGVISLTASAAGPIRRLAESTFKAGLDFSRVGGEIPGGGAAFEAEGKIGLEGKELRGDGLVVRTGASSVVSDLRVVLDEAFKPSRVEIEARVDAAAGDLSRLAGDLPVEMSGGIKGRFKASGAPAVFAGLFPAGDGPVDAEAVGRAWKESGLEGSLSVSGGRVAAPAPAPAVSGLALDLTLAGGDVTDLKASFELDGRPWSLRGTAAGIMPCLSEMAALSRAKAGAGAEPSSLGSLLDGIRNRPSVSMRIEGRAFDARPFEKKEKAQEAGQAGKPESSGAAGKTEGDPLAAAGAALLNTRFTASLDSLITEKAIFTGVRAEGSAVGGVVRARKVELDYAGGKGRGTAEIDLRDYPGVVSDFDLSMTGVQADRALVRIHSLGALLKGTFSFKTAGKAASGPGIDFLSALSAAGDATSTSGTLDLSGIIGSLTGALPLDLSAVEKVDFRSWTGNYEIRDGRLATEDWKIASKSGDWDITGSFGFDGGLDYRARLVIPPAVQSTMKDLRKYGDLVDLFRDESGNIVLRFDIGGTARQPRVSLDQSAAKDKAGKKLMDSLKEGAADKLKDLFKKKD